VTRAAVTCPASGNLASGAFAQTEPPPSRQGGCPGCGVPGSCIADLSGSASQTTISAVSSYEPPRGESRGSEASAPFWSCSGLSSERAVPIAATPAARAAFLATRLAFGRRAFFVVPVLVALVVFFLVAGLFALFAFLVFDLVFARLNEDLALARLTLFFMNCSHLSAGTSARPTEPFTPGQSRGLLSLRRA
jgi:hypothetical protein